MRQVSKAEFDAYVAAYPGGLQMRGAGQARVYYDDAAEEPWPENIRASFLPAGNGRRRATGWRIADEGQE